MQMELNVEQHAYLDIRQLVEKQQLLMQIAILMFQLQQQHQEIS